MHDSVKRMLDSYALDSEDKALHALREILQEIALLGLWRGKFFEHAAFYGGTALRILYGLERFSEDLDFSLLQPHPEFHLEQYLSGVERELHSFGFRVRVENKKGGRARQIHSAFVKADTLQSLIEISAEGRIVDSIHPGWLLKIKLEVDTDPPPGFHAEAKYLLRPVAFAVRSFTLPSLFAGKLHAILCRKWKNRVKGRDWYDLVWYLGNYPQLHLAHLEARMRQSGHWKKDINLDRNKLFSLLEDAVEKLDIVQAKNDVKPFLKEPGEVDIWSKDFFETILERIVIV